VVALAQPATQTPARHHPPARTPSHARAGGGDFKNALREFFGPDRERAGASLGVTPRNAQGLESAELRQRAGPYNPYRFTGRRLDVETGLSYFRARYMSHEQGRFVGRDPLGYIDGRNLYRSYFVPFLLDPSGKHSKACLDYCNDKVNDTDLWGGGAIDYFKRCLDECKKWENTAGSDGGGPGAGGGGPGASEPPECPKGCDPCDFSDGASKAEDWYLGLVAGKTDDQFRCEVAKIRCFAKCAEQPPECQDACFACCTFHWLRCIRHLGGGPKRTRTEDDDKFDTEVIDHDVNYEHDTGNSGGNRP